MYMVVDYRNLRKVLQNTNKNASPLTKSSLGVRKDIGKFFASGFHSFITFNIIIEIKII